MSTREHRIRDIAHRLWEQEGRPHHQEKRHWEMAERMVDEQEKLGAESAPAIKPAVKSAPAAKPAAKRAPRAKGAAAPRKKTRH